MNGPISREDSRANLNLSENSSQENEISNIDIENMNPRHDRLLVSMEMLYSEMNSRWSYERDSMVSMMRAQINRAINSRNDRGIPKVQKIRGKKLSRLRLCEIRVTAVLIGPKNSKSGFLIRD